MMGDMLRLPERTFAAGDEPIGEKVNSYHKAKRINSILNALDPDEIDFLRNSPFGKIIATSELPSFSRRFGHYIITRLLKVNKKYEIWILFAGRPIRMSLREFGIVTGLRCGPLPKVSKKKKRNLVNEKPYWPDLFGKLKVCTVDSAIDMLKKKKIKDKEIRLKYACLAITSSVLLPKSYFPKIIPEHVEMIQDLQEFLSYPWGRVSFQMLVSSIKAKDEVALSQTTVSFNGFVDALQLVLLAAVPSLKEVVQVNDSSLDLFISESDSEDPSPNQAKIILNPRHARDLDKECQVDVQCIIDGVDDVRNAETDLVWQDEDEDDLVDNMVRLIGEGHRFKKEMFKGGLKASDLTLMRNEKKLKGKEVEEKKKKDKPTDTINLDNAEALGFHNVVSEVKSQMIELRNNLRGDVIEIEQRLTKTLEDKLEAMQASVIQGIMDFLGSSNSNVAMNDVTMEQGYSADVQNKEATRSRTDANHVFNTVMGDINWSSNIHETNHDLFGDTQQLSCTENIAHSGGDYTDVPDTQIKATNIGEGRPLSDTPIGKAIGDDIVHEENDTGETRKSKRTRTLLPILNDCHYGHGQPSDVEDLYQKLQEHLKQNRTISIGNGTSLTNLEVVDIAERVNHMAPKVMDALMYYSRIALMRKCSSTFHPKKIEFFDTSFPASIIKQYSRFIKTAIKDRARLKFKDVVTHFFSENNQSDEIPKRFYFPFNMDKQHWVGVCVDTAASALQVLDCNASFRSDSLMKKDLNPIAQLLPYIIKKATHEGECTKVDKPYSISRLRGIPQTSILTDSAVMTVLLIQVHAIWGLDGCKCITPATLPREAQQLAALFYQEFVETL